MDKMTRMFAVAIAVVALTSASGSLQVASASVTRPEHTTSAVMEVAKAPVPECQECYAMFLDAETGLYWGWAGAVCEPGHTDGCADCNFGNCNGWGWYTENCTYGCSSEPLLDELDAFVERGDAQGAARLLKGHSDRLILDTEIGTVQGVNCGGAVERTVALQLGFGRAVATAYRALVSMDAGQ